MPIELPAGPPPLDWEEFSVRKFERGEACNWFPLEGRMRVDFTTPIGGWTNGSYSLFFQLPKWGYVRFKITEATFVSPVFREYYELTVRQKEQIEAQIKQGLASVSTAITDMELVYHDIRKYRDYLDYMTWIEKGKLLIKQGKKEEGESLKKKGEQTIKAIFIDEVDVHTGELIALKSIAPRWPTIIADFMQLSDDETDQKKISEKHKISEAEGVVLATKNKLYLQWRDRIFFDTVKRRYRNLVMVLEARKKSVDEYRNMLRPTISRYKMLNDALASKELRTDIQRSWLHPEAQAQSADWMTIWAWKPFSPNEKYKQSRESLDKISALDAGFTKDDIKELMASAKSKEIIMKGTEVDGLPVEPSIDHIVREYIPAIEKEWGVKISATDIFKARQMLVNQFKETAVGLGGREPWVWSPYFAFIEIPMFRTVLRLPNGEEIEDVQIENIAGSTQSQNLIIIHLLELVAKEKQLDNYISELLGEKGYIEDESGKRLVPIEEMMKEDYPEIFISKEEEYKKFMEKIEKQKHFAKKTAQATKFKIGDTLDKFGLRMDYLTARGPYEFALNQRVTKLYQTIIGPEFGRVVSYMKSKFGVPGFAESVPW
ncbi:MAG: hypothetical protein V1944_00980 [Candidatus Aenigmatarchaeota archaeon]